jgi:hypothetical protein
VAQLCVISLISTSLYVLILHADSPARDRMSQSPPHVSLIS